MNRRVIAAVVAVVVLLTAGVGLWLWRRSSAAAEAGVAAASLERCLIGSPLEPGETVGARVHRIALGDPPAEWPSRCTGYAKDLATALERAGRRSDAAELDAKWGKGFDLAAMEQNPWSVTLPAVPKDVQVPADVPAAPAVVQVPDERTAPLVPRATLAKASSDAMPGSALHVILSPDHFCSFSEKLDSATCKSLAKLAPQGAQSFELWPPTDDGAPSWVTDFVLPGGRVQRFFRADSGLLVDTRNPDRAVHAYGYRDGSVATLGPAEGEREGLDLTLWKGREHEKPYTLDLDARTISLFGDRLLWVKRADDDLDHLYSAKVSTAPVEVGKPEDLGALEVAPSSFDACRTKDALAVVMSRGSDSRVLFFSETGASPIHQAKLRSDASIAHRAFACGASDVTITRVVTRTRARSETDVTGFIVQHARCTAEGCSTGETDVDEMLAGSADAVRPPGEKATELVAGGLDGKLMVVWRSRSRGVRARVADPKQIAGAKDVLVYDDGVKEGRATKASSIFRMALFPRRDAAALLLERVADGGVVALRVDAAGATSPVSPKP